MQASTEPGALAWWKTAPGIAALTTPLLGFLVTLPTEGNFFSPGQDLGRGFLLGGVAALLAAAVSIRARRAGGIEASIGLAAAAAATAVLTLRGSVIDGLSGVAIGWFVTTFPLVRIVSARFTPVDTNGGPAATLAAGAGFAAAVCATAALGIWRDPLTPEIDRGTWTAIVLAYVALSAVLLLGCRLLLPAGSAARRTAAGRFAPGYAAAACFVALSVAAVRVLTLKVGPEPRLFYLAVLGMLAWLIAAWLIADSQERDSPRNPRSLAAGLPPLATLVVAAGFMAAFQLLRGLGAGMFVLSLWLCSAALPRRSSRVVVADVGLLLFATVLLLDRAFAARYADDMSGVTLTDQYALFGLLVGALTPGLLAAMVGRCRADGASGVLSLVLGGTLTLGIPAVLLLLFGGKCALALLIGLALGGAQTFRTDRGDAGPGMAPGESTLPGLFAIACALALFQFTGHLLPLTEMTRLHKAELTGVLVLCVALVLAGSDVVAARRRPVAHPSAAIGEE
jgi:hypothetical protein